MPLGIIGKFVTGATSMHSTFYKQHSPDSNSKQGLLATLSGLCHDDCIASQCLGWLSQTALTPVGR